MNSAASGRRGGPLACVMGTLDLVRPLGLAGIRCAAVASAGHPVHFSRFVDVRIDSDRSALADRLVELARSQTDPPVLFYESDDDLEYIAEHRERLERTFRFVLPPAELLRGLLDKERFLALAQRLDLPVPRSDVLTPQAADAPPAELAATFPLVLKPLPYRNHEWYTHISSAKILPVDSLETLQALWPRLRTTRLRFLAQELVASPETQVASYHVYIDAQGRIAGEFAGRKVRTFPREFGRSTALETTDDREVLATGRDIVERLGLTGVAKLDFKRDARGRLYLLEVNPRYSLWMHLGAVAGVNLAAIAYADATGSPPPRPVAARPGVRWCWPRPDAKAARDLGVSWWSWLRWTVSADARTNLFWDDPMPFLRGWLRPKLPAGRRRAMADA